MNDQIVYQKLFSLATLWNIYRIFLVCNGYGLIVDFMIRVIHWCFLTILWTVFFVSVCFISFSKDENSVFFSFNHTK